MKTFLVLMALATPLCFAQESTDSIQTVEKGSTLTSTADIVIPAAGEGSDTVRFQDGKQIPMNEELGEAAYCHLVVNEASDDVRVLKPGRALEIESVELYGQIKDRHLFFVNFVQHEFSHLKGFECYSKVEREDISIAQLRTVFENFFTLELAAPQKPEAPKEPVEIENSTSERNI
jgi:hypothetical protein